MVKTNKKSIAKSKQTLKLFRFVPLFTIKQRGGKTVYCFLGIPLWKIRRMEKQNLVKYYILNIPVFRFHCTPPANPLKELRQEIDVYLHKLEQNLKREIKQQHRLMLDRYLENINLYQNNNRERLTVYHRELLERLDNLPKKINIPK